MISRKLRYPAAIAGLLLIAGWFLWPVYGFFAHNGDVPLLPFGWHEIGDEAPVTSEVMNPAYKAAAAEAVSLLAQHRQKIGSPAFSAAVAVRGEIVWAGTVGWADLATETPATPQTQFRIGSTSKAVTATALARLVDRGIIDLDTPISAYWEELPNPAWADITPRQLASHMAGIPHYGENTEYLGLYEMMASRRHFTETQDAAALFDESDLLSEPGTQFYYSSLGTVLLGATMSEAASEPYLDIIRQDVLEPAGASSTIAAPKRPGKEDHLATFYAVRGEKARAWRPVDLSHRLPGGGFASTSSDLVQIGSLWFDARVISPQTRDIFWTPQKLKSGETNEQDYALGWRWREWELEGAGLARNANHGGVSRGAQSWLLVFPDDELAIAININRNTEEFWEFGQAYELVYRAFIGTVREQAAD